MKIIAFGNSRYKRIAHNWALYLQKHGITNYTIYSLDHDIYDYLVENKINTELLELHFFHARRYRWNLRFKYISDLLLQDESVLHSDLDAVWLKNPLEFIDDTHDIIASTGSYPFGIRKKFGSTICCGWIYYNSTFNVKKLFNDILSQYGNKYFHDQRVLNNAIFLDKKYQNVKLKFLDQTLISRDQPHNQNTYVAHPLSNSYLDREAFLQQQDLWILADH